jgi:hypothetical protein
MSICLPFLRPVWQSRRGTGQPYGSNGKGNGGFELNSSTTGRSKRGRLGTGGSMLASRAPGPGFTRTDSNEDILGKEASVGSASNDYPVNGITKTFQFDVRSAPVEP